MRREPHTTQKPRPRHARPSQTTTQAPRTGRAHGIGRLPGRWLAAVLITGTAAAIGTATLVAPSASYTAVGNYATASLSAPASTGCRGVTPAVFPAQGFIANPARTQGGHLWWRRSTPGVCIGTVVEWVRYNATATKTWRVIVYSTQHPDGQVVAHRTFTLGRGWYFWGFGVHQVYAGLLAVCLTADDAFGSSCINFGR